MALKLRELADALLRPVSTLTGLPTDAVSALVEGRTPGAVAGDRAQEARKLSAYETQ